MRPAQTSRLGLNAAGRRVAAVALAALTVCAAPAHGQWIMPFSGWKFTEAVMGNDVARAKAILNRIADVNASYSDGPVSSSGESNTLLHAAAYWGSSDICRLLLAKGAKPDLADKQGFTALHYTVLFNECEMDGGPESPFVSAKFRMAKEATCQLLFDRGADVTLKNRDGDTPLHLAVVLWPGGGYTQEVSRAICEKLIAAGASLAATNNEGLTPLELVLDRDGRPDIAALLRRHAEQQRGTGADTPTVGLRRSVALLPVPDPGVGRIKRFVPAAEAALDLQALGLDTFVVVDRAMVARLFAELEQDLGQGRRDLKAGHLVGAQVLLASRLTPGPGESAELTLSAIETATGNILRETTSRLLAPADASEPVRMFIGELPRVFPKEEHLTDVALLPIEHISPFPEPGGLAESFRRRLADRVGSLPGMRVLHRELGEFVLAEAALAAGGHVPPELSHAPRPAVVRVRGTLRHTIADGEPLGQSRVELELSVETNTAQRKVTVRGNLDGMAALEREAAMKIAEAVGSVVPLATAAATDSVVTAEPASLEDRRYWEAQQYLVMAREKGRDRESVVDLCLKVATLAL